MDDIASANASLQAALAEFQQRRPDRAVALCREAIDRNPTMADAHHLLGLSLHAAGQSELGMKAVRHAIELSPQNAEYQTNLGKLLRDRGRLDEAFEVFQRTSKSHPNHASVQFNYGQALNKRKEFAGAIAPLQRAVAINPDYVTAWNSLGNALSQLGNHAQAVEAYGHVPASHPLASSSLLGRVKSLKTSGQIDEAVALLEDQPHLDQQPQAVISLIDLYVTQGRNRRGIPLGKPMPRPLGSSPRCLR